jgi:hypothetical protein
MYYYAAESISEVAFECKAKTVNEADDTEIKDEIKFKVKRGEQGLKVKVEYEQEIETNSTEMDTETQYEISYDRLVEYMKSDNSTSAGGAAYDWEIDTVLQTIDLVSWQTFSAVQDDADGITSVFHVTTTDETVTFTFTISRAEKTEVLTANSMKIDFQLKNFTWASPNSYVALISTIESKRKVEVENDEQDEKNVDEVRISFADAVDSSAAARSVVPFGEYRWATTAVAASNATDGRDSATIEVIATSGAAANTIAFSFVGEGAQGSSNIFWDPEAGIAYASSSGTSSAYAPSSNSNSASVFTGVATLFLMGRLMW